MRLLIIKLKEISFCIKMEGIESKLKGQKGLIGFLSLGNPEIQAKLEEEPFILITKNCIARILVRRSHNYDFSIINVQDHLLIQSRLTYLGDLGDFGDSFP